MKKTIQLIIITLMSCSLIHAQWRSINPGAGGQVQDVVGDPNHPGRLYLASDMEGVYKSEDNGESWEMTGQLMHNRVYAVTVDPDNSERLYVGTMYGLHISDDGGESYKFVHETRNRTIASIAVDPTNSDYVIAGPGWRDDLGFFEQLGETSKGEGSVFRSEDGGMSWTEIIFDANTNTNRNVWNIVYDQANSFNVYLGTVKGIFNSQDGGLTWSKISNPPGGTVNRGISLSPDGSILYAAYNSAGRIFATPTSSVDWQEVMDGGGIQLENLKYWYPEVDSRSTSATHKLLVGMEGQREGLFEGTFQWSGSTLESYSWKRIWDDTGGWDRGWDYATPNARYAHYTPSGWDRAIWSTTNQTIYQAIPDGDKYQWINKYCIPNEAFQIPFWGMTFPTYSGRGTESTYTYDIAVHRNYVIQGQGDNGFMESWDYGFSWSNMQHRRDGMNLSDVQAVDVADAWGMPLVVAQATSGYGGYATDGRLYIKALKKHSPTDTWEHLGAGPDKLLGIGDGILRDIAVSPANPAKIFIFSSGYGMYMIEDIGRTLDYRSKGKVLEAEHISTSTIASCGSAKKISPHPINEDIVFFNSSSGNQGVFKGVYSDGKWEWTKIYSGYGWDSEVHCWEHEGQVYLMYSGYANGDQGDGNHTIAALSLDEGDSWEIIFNKEKAKELRMPEWYDEWADIYTFKTKGGPAAYGNTIIQNYYHHGFQLPFGMFKGTIESDGSINWEDWTGDLHYPGPTSSIFAETNDSLFFYTATAGAGAWVRSIKPVTNIPSKPETPEIVAAEAISTKNIVVSWNDLADDESGYRIERKSGEGSFKIIGQVGRNRTSYTDFDLFQNMSYTYRVVAFNSAGTSGYSTEISATTPGSNLLSCIFPNLVENGNFEENLDGWRLYTNSWAQASMSVSGEPGFSGEKAAKVSITKMPASGSELDIQFYYPFFGLEAGKQYEVSFKAKASKEESLRFLVLLNDTPYSLLISENIAVNTEVQYYGPYSFDVSEDLDSVRIDFFLGNKLMDLWIDTVVIREAGECLIENIDSLTLDNCQGEMDVGESQSMTYSIYPELTGDLEVLWSTSDTTVAKVSQDGVVSALSEGVVQINLTPARGPAIASASCTTTVKRISGIGEVRKNFPLLYPNPVKMGDNVYLNIYESGSCLLEILDISGKSIYKVDHLITHGEEIEISGDYFDKEGVFLVKLTNDIGVNTIKLMVN